jgi:hypothetical protein
MSIFPSLLGIIHWGTIVAMPSELWGAITRSHSRHKHFGRTILAHRSSSGWFRVSGTHRPQAHGIKPVWSCDLDDTQGSAVSGDVANGMFSMQFANKIHCLTGQE